MSHPGWTSWSLDPAFLGAIALAAWAYSYAYRRARRLAPKPPGLGHWLPFAAGLVVLTLALASPLDGAGDAYRISAHLGQHVLLVVAAPALLVLGLRTPVLPLGLPRGGLRWIAPGGRLGRCIHVATRPWVALPAWALATWGWAIPPVHAAAAESPALHAVQHAALFYAGLAVWWLIVDPLHLDQRTTQTTGTLMNKQTIRFRTTALGAALALTTLAALPAAAAAHPGHDHGSARRPAAARQARQQSVAIEFAAVAGRQPVRCGAPIPGLGTTDQTAQLTDFRFFVSDVTLLRRSGRPVALRLRADSPWRVTAGGHGVTLIDLENGRGGCAGGTRGTNAFVRGTVPAGDYVGASWTVGVPFALNHTDATLAPAPLNSAAMAWSWQSGRKYSKIEVSQPDDATPAWGARTFFVHLGATGCEGNPATGATVRCAASNRAEISLGRFDAGRQKVAVDLKTMLAGNDVTQNGSGAPGCMSSPTDPECGPVFRAFGLRLPRVSPDDDGGMDMGGGDGGMDHGAMVAQATPRQTVFRPIAR